MSTLGRPLPWQAAIADYCMWMAARGSNEMSLRPRRSHLGALAREAACGPWEVTQADLLAFMGRSSWKPETRKSARNAVRSFYGWALDNELIMVDPSRRLPPVRIPPTVPKPVPDDVIYDALSRASARDQLMVLLGASAGLRRAEIAQVHTSHVTVRADGVWLRVTGKGGRTRTVPVSPPLSDLLLALPPGFAFPGRENGHLSNQWVGQRLTWLLGPGWSGHKLRHRFATTAYAAERDLLAVQTLLGHSKPETTARYTALPGEALRAGVVHAAMLTEG